MKRSRDLFLLPVLLLGACSDANHGTIPSAEVTEHAPEMPIATTSISQHEDDAGACATDAGACDGPKPNPPNPSPSPRCGDGKVDDKAEECDDGNSSDDDACSNACLKNECGNGRVDVNEECDDGNHVDADKCSNQCLWVRCRNGRLDPGEDCDDGNDRDDDGCSNRCHIMKCGNGKQEDKEECDDGNQVDTDTCSNHCTSNKCGNGRKDPGEECDGDLDCDDKCKSKPDLCKQCEEKYCRTDYPQAGVGIDWLAGCVNGMPPFVDTADPSKQPPGQTSRLYPPEEFIQKCMGIVNCVRKSMCLQADDFGVIYNHCYCGSASLDVCFQTGPVGSACEDVIVAAGEVDKSDYTHLSERAIDPAYPMGWAANLVNCDRDRCSAECTPWLPVVPYCGNGKLEMGEACDDGNQVDTDACSNSCMNH